MAKSDKWNGNAAKRKIMVCIFPQIKTAVYCAVSRTACDCKRTAISVALFGSCRWTRWHLLSARTRPRSGLLHTLSFILCHFLIFIGFFIANHWCDLFSCKILQSICDLSYTGWLCKFEKQWEADIYFRIDRQRAEALDFRESQCLASYFSMKIMSLEFSKVVKRMIN